MHRTISTIRRSLATGAVVALLLALVPEAFAQQRAGFTALYPGQPRVSVGARAGASFATLSGDAFEEAGYRPGFAGGLFATVNVNPLLAIQPEVLFVQRGATVDEDGGLSPFGTDQADEIRINAIEIPLLVRVAVPTQSAARPHLFFGPSLGVVLSASREFDDGTLGEDDDLFEDDDFEDALKSTDVGMVVGGGLDVRLPVAGKVTLDGRYTVGLTDVFDEEELGLAEAPDAKNGTFQVSLGFGL